MFMREKTSPLLASAIAFPVVFKEFWISEGVKTLFFSAFLNCLSKANAAETWGVAIDVPEAEAYPLAQLVNPLGQSHVVEFIAEPVAKR